MSSHPACLNLISSGFCGFKSIIFGGGGCITPSTLSWPLVAVNAAGNAKVTRRASVRYLYTSVPRFMTKYMMRPNFTRRDFLKTSSTLAAAAALAPGVFAANDETLKIEIGRAHV